MAAPLDPLARLISEFEKLPGIGPRTAERLAYHLLKSEPEVSFRLSEALRELKERLVPCRECFHISDGGQCVICADDSRDGTVLCVVEQPKDLIAIERLGFFRGKYHVLLGRVSPHEGIGPDKLTISALKDRLNSPESQVREVIVATNPDAEGDATLLALRRALRGVAVKITRLARGLPSGSTLDYANVEILRDAFEGRRDLPES